MAKIFISSQIEFEFVRDYNQIMLNSSPLVVVVIPHWNQKKVIGDCLDSLSKSTYPNMKVFVVDNASLDDSVPYIAENFPWVHLIKRTTNGGYAAALNTGIMATLKDRPLYYFALNNDTVVPPGTIEHLVSVMENDPEIGIVAPLVLYESDPNLTFSLGDKVYKYLPLPITLGSKKRDSKKNHKLVEFDYVFGCAQLIRKTALDKIGLFDEFYFMFFEDADICRRARDAGYKIIRDGSTSILHKGSASVRTENAKMIWFRARNRILFYRKYRHGPSLPITHILLGVGSIWRIIKFLFVGRIDLVIAQIKGAVTGYHISVTDSTQVPRTN